jgi:hypothetical protein
MQYEVHPVRGASTEPLRHKPSVDDIADEIAAMYAFAAKEGGRIVAGHSLVCDETLPMGDNEQRRVRIDHLFLVIELPDDFSREQDEPLVD